MPNLVGINQLSKAIWLLSFVIVCNGSAVAATLWPDFPLSQFSQLDKQTPQTPNEPQPPAKAKPPNGQGWIARCVSNARKSPVECSIEETLVMANSGQLIASVVVRIPPDSHDPLLTIRIPVGLYLPSGVNIQIDDGKPQPVPLQTCDLQGCFAEMPLSASVLAALKSGQRLSIIFQNLLKNNVVLPLPLDNFADALQKIL
jgi:invasion protein IalB